MRTFAAVVAGFAVLVPPVAFGQTADKFVGTWRSTAKVGGFDHEIKLSRNGDEWRLDSTYFKNDKASGSAVGRDVRFVDGGLSYKHKFLKKPAASWKESSDIQRLVLNGERLEWTNGKEKRSYSRVGGPAVAQAAPKVDAKNPTPMPQPDDPTVPASFEGIWMGEIPGGKMTLLLKITKGPSKKGDQVVVEAFLTDDGKFKGHLHSPNLRFDTAKGSELHVNQAWDNTPGVSRAGFAKLSLLRAKGGLVLTGTGLARSGTSTALLKAVDASEIAKLPSPPPPPMVVAKSRGDSGSPAAPDNSVGPKSKSVKAKYVLEKPVPLPKIAPTPIESTFSTESCTINVSVPMNRISLLDRANAEYSMTVFDIDSKKKLWAGNATVFRKAILSPDGKTVVYNTPKDALPHGVTKLCDVDSGKVLQTLEGDRVGPIHPTKPYFFRHEIDKAILVDLKTGKDKWSVRTGLRQTVFDPTGNYCVIDALAEGRFNTDVSRVYEVETGMKVLDLPDTCSTRGCGFSPDGKRVGLLCSNYYRCMVKIFDIETGEAVCSTPTFPSTNHERHPVDFSPDGKTIAICSGDKTVRFYDAATGQFQRFHALDDQPYDVYVLADNERVLTGGQKGIRIYRIANAVTPMQAAAQGAAPTPDTEPPNP